MQVCDAICLFCNPRCESAMCIAENHLSDAIHVHCDVRSRCSHPLRCRHHCEAASMSLQTARIRFRRVRFWTPSSVSFLAFSELQGENSVSSSQPIFVCRSELTKFFCRPHRVWRKAQWSEKNKGGWKTQGRGKAYHKTPPRKRFWTPPAYDTFPPPLCSRNVIFFGGNGHRPDKSQFLRPPKLVLQGALYGTLSPPKIARYVLPPPPLRIPKVSPFHKSAPETCILPVSYVNTNSSVTLFACSVHCPDSGSTCVHIWNLPGRLPPAHVMRCAIPECRKTGIFGECQASPFGECQIRQEKGTQTQTSGSGYLPVGRRSSRWRGGDQKVRYVPRNPRKPNFLAGYPGIFARISRRCPKS